VLGVFGWGWVVLGPQRIVLNAKEA